MKHFLTIALTAGLLSAGTIAEARQAAPLPQKSPAPVLLTDDRDARETRERLRDLLDQYPPSVREVMRIDPTLMTRDDYLSTYPVLRTFLQQHPEVAHNPAFFVGETRVAEENRNSPQMEAARAVRDFLEGIVTVLVVMTLTAGVVFLVKTVVDHRRWQRAMKAQADLHTKLIDRFAASDELLAHLQSPQGKVLTDAPSMPPAATRAMDAPLGRIFWSLQAGSVLACAGIGALIVSGRMGDTLDVVAPTFSAFGTVILTIGVGFLVSSAISFFLSQRLGLVRPLSVRDGSEAPGS